jgi:hypothetical protein
MRQLLWHVRATGQSTCLVKVILFRGKRISWLKLLKLFSHLKDTGQAILRNTASERTVANFQAQQRFAFSSSFHGINHYMDTRTYRISPSFVFFVPVRLGTSILECSAMCSPITVAERSKAWTVFARSNAGIVGSNPNQGMDVCVRLFCLCYPVCVGSGLGMGWSPVQGVLPTA